MPVVPAYDGGIGTALAITPGPAIWFDLVLAYPDWDPQVMARIVGCESGGRHVASPPDSDGLRNYGPFQIHGEPQALYDDAYGATRAHEKYGGALEAGGTGYEPWRGSRSCWG